MPSKQIVSADSAVNWYFGNFIESPDNALLAEGASFEELDNSLPASSNFGRALEEKERLRVELKGKMMTHKELLGLMKQRGIHGKYYRNKKYENNCLACEGLWDKVG